MDAIGSSDDVTRQEFTCLYCKRAKTRSDDPDTTEDSEEHIVPDSIGGCCTITGVCKRCNSTFGSEVESYKGFLTWIMVRLTAAKLGITGHSGTPHPVLFDKRATFKGATAAGRPAMDLTANLSLGYGWMDGFIVPITGEDGSFTASTEHMTRWKERVTQRIARQHGNVQVEFHEVQYDVSQSPIEFHLQENHDLIARTLGKIGLCYLSFELGHDTALGTAFDPLRAYVHSGQNADPPFAGITRPDLSLYRPRPALHLLSLLQDGSSMFCVISIFNVAAALVYLGDGRIPPEAQNRILVMDPVAGVSRTCRVPAHLHRQWADNLTLPSSPVEEAASCATTAPTPSSHAITASLLGEPVDVVTLLQMIVFDNDQRSLFLARLNANLPTDKRVTDNEIEALVDMLLAVDVKAEA